MKNDIFIHDTSAGATTIVQLPLAFVRSGYMNLEYGRVGNHGNEAAFWSRTSISSTRVYIFDSNHAIIFPSGSDNSRWYGFPLRCLYPSLSRQSN